MASSSQLEALKQTLTEINTSVSILTSRVTNLERKNVDHPHHVSGVARERLIEWTNPWAVLPFAILISWVLLRIAGK